MLHQTDFRKILLVEDDKITQKIHMYFLKKLGFAVDVVSTGSEALKKLNISLTSKRRKTSPATSNDYYFAMILDLGLPDINGEVVLSKIRTREKDTGRHLPVIVVTAHGDRTIINHCKTYQQADGGFQKPVKLLDLEQALQNLTHYEPIIG
jgi:CheY-like chemotaxis protein